METIARILPGGNTEPCGSPCKAVPHPAGRRVHSSEAAQRQIWILPKNRNSWIDPTTTRHAAPHRAVPIRL